MSNGTIGWRELMTPEPEKSERFYGELFGWSIKTVPFGPTQYRLINAGEKQIAGIMEFKKPGIPPHWVSYITVADVDAAANAAKANGGTIANAPMDIPDVGAWRSRARTPSEKPRRRIARTRANSAGRRSRRATSPKPLHSTRKFTRGRRRRASPATPISSTRVIE